MTSRSNGASLNGPSSGLLPPYGAGPVRGRCDEAVEGPGFAVRALPRARQSAVGRLLRTLRLAAGLSQEDAAIAIEVPIRRVKDLEAGRETLGYLEGLRLAKAYLLCPTCFRRAFEAALDRQGLDAPVADDTGDLSGAPHPDG